MEHAGKVTETILKCLEKEGPGSTWSFADFKKLPMSSVAKALSRLAKSGKLVRVRKGVYHYPKKTVLGPSTSSPVAVIGALYPKTYAAGTSAAYNLGITTQIPAGLTYYGDVSYSKHEILGAKVRFRKRDIRHLKSLGETEINVLETLRNLKKIPATTPYDVLLHVKKNLKSSGKVRELLKAATKEPPRVRALIGAICEELKIEAEALEALHRTLNPLTHYSLGVKDVLSFADRWNIK